METRRDEGRNISLEGRILTVKLIPVGGSLLSRPEGFEGPGRSMKEADVRESDVGWGGLCLSL